MKESETLAAGSAYADSAATPLGIAGDARWWLAKLPRRPELGDIVELVSRQRRRHLRIERTEILRSADQPCGAWLAMHNCDVILVASSAPPFAYDHIVLHELAHMLLGHDDPDTDVWSELFPSFSKETIRRVILNRSRYDRQHESDAEELASELHARLTSAQPSQLIRSRFNLGRFRPRAWRLARYSESLDPLWRALMSVEPGITLQTQSGNPELILTRKLVELHDGLMTLSRGLPPDALQYELAATGAPSATAASWDQLIEAASQWVVAGLQAAGASTRVSGEATPTPGISGDAETEARFFAEVTHRCRPWL